MLFLNLYPNVKLVVEIRVPCAIKIFTAAQTAVREVQEETGIKTGMVIA